MQIPEFSAEDIMAAEQTLGVMLRDPERLQILRFRESTDIWACPGSGKTTLLVAKLFLLSRQWRVNHRGICALSHTNVARDEIQQRLRGTRLLDSPHFIGTIQRFVHQFIAFPAIAERFQLSVQSVHSTEQITRLIQRELEKPSNGSVRAWLDKLPNPDFVLNGIRLSGPDLRVTIPRLTSDSSKVYKQLAGIKTTLTERGIFSFRDMYALGRWYIDRHPVLAAAIAYRFPIVFFDEMQDTDQEQWDLLKAIFEERSIIQRFGDHNQAIFHGMEGGTPCTFPVQPFLTMNQSKRLSRSIAHLVEKLSVTEPPDLMGNPARRNLRHQVLLFSPETVKEVLPEFARQVSSQLVLASPVIKAVGAVTRTGAGAGGVEPCCIQDYWEDFSPRVRGRDTKPNSLAGFVRQAQREVLASGNVGAAFDLIVTSVVEILRHEDFRQADGKLYSRQTLIQHLEDTAPNLVQDLRDAILDICSTAPAGGVELRRHLRAIYDPVRAILGSRPKNSRAFLTDELEVEDEIKPSAPMVERNVYKYVDGETQVDITVGTIHSVKGETHDATLVMETRFHEFDLESAKPYLLGTWKPPRGPRLANHLRRLYVAMTRPKELLCLAVSRSHITMDESEKLRDRGWDVVELE